MAVTKKNGPNYGRWFETCPKQREQQCYNQFRFRDDIPRGNPSQPQYQQQPQQQYQQQQQQPPQINPQYQQPQPQSYTPQQLSSGPVVPILPQAQLNLPVVMESEVLPDGQTTLPRKRPRVESQSPDVSDMVQMKTLILSQFNRRFDELIEQFDAHWADVLADKKSLDARAEVLTGLVLATKKMNAALGVYMEDTRKRMEQLTDQVQNLKVLLVEVSTSMQKANNANRTPAKTRVTRGKKLTRTRTMAPAQAVANQNATDVFET